MRLEATSVKLSQCLHKNTNEACFGDKPDMTACINAAYIGSVSPTTYKHEIRPSRADVQARFLLQSSERGRSASLYKKQPVRSSALREVSLPYQSSVHLPLGGIGLLGMVLRPFSARIDDRHRKIFSGLPHDDENDGVARPVCPHPATGRHGQLPLPKPADPLHPRIKELEDRGLDERGSIWIVRFAIGSSSDDVWHPLERA